jgi:hypothetical protein
VQHQSARPIGRLNEGDTDTKQGQLKELKRLLESSVLEEHKVKVWGERNSLSGNYVY